MVNPQENGQATGPLTPEDPVQGNRLHINVGFSCNNNCIFCMEEDRTERYSRLIHQTVEDVRRMMEASHNAEMVMFTSGEPTLNPDLVRYIQLAKELGFKEIGMISNGRRLGYAKYTYTLLNAGLNHVLVSLHGPNARVHDALTRTRGSFEQTLRGIKVLSAMKRMFPNLKLHTSFVVTRRNMDFFKEFYDLVAPLVDQMVFNMMMPDGRGATYFDQLMPRYSDVVQRFADFLRQIPAQDHGRVFLLDVPYCVTEGLPDASRGYVERYFHFEPGDSPGFDDVRVTDDTLVQPGAVEGEAATYTKVEKSLRDSQVRTKRPQCMDCAYNHVCQGVFTIYLKHYGWAEFEPVNNGPRKEAKVEQNRRQRQ